MVHKTFGAKYPHEQIESRAGEFLVNLHHVRVGLMAKVWSQRIGIYTIIAVWEPTLMANGRKNNWFSCVSAQTQGTIYSAQIWTSFCEHCILDPVISVWKGPAYAICWISMNYITMPCLTQLSHTDFHAVLPPIWSSNVFGQFMPTTCVF